MKKDPIICGFPNSLEPLTYRDIRRLIGFGVLGLVVLAVGAFPNIRPPRNFAWLIVAAWAVIPAAVFIHRLSRMSRNKTVEISPRSTIQVKAFAIVMLLFGGCLFFWASRQGLPFQVIVGILLMVEGLGGIIVSLTEWWRLSHFGLSTGLMVGGFLLPVEDFNSIGIPVGTAVLAGCVLSAAILYWQVRYHERQIRYAVNHLDTLS